jgi:hypothetical protein
MSDFRLKGRIRCQKEENRIALCWGPSEGIFSAIWAPDVKSTMFDRARVLLLDYDHVPIKLSLYCTETYILDFIFKQTKKEVLFAKAFYEPETETLHFDGYDRQDDLVVDGRRECKFPITPLREYFEDVQKDIGSWHEGIRCHRLVLILQNDAVPSEALLKS